MSDLSPYQRIVKAAEGCEPLELDVVEVQWLARDEHIKAICERQCTDFALGLPGRPRKCLRPDCEKWPAPDCQECNR